MMRGRKTSWILLPSGRGERHKWGPCPDSGEADAINGVPAPDLGQADAMNGVSATDLAIAMFVRAVEEWRWRCEGDHKSWGRARRSSLPEALRGSCQTKWMA